MPELTESAKPAPAALPMPASPSPPVHAPSDKNWLVSLVSLALWPVIFLIGIHMLADAVAQIQLSVVIQKTDERKPIVDKLNQTGEAIGDLRSELQQETSQIQQQIRRNG